MRYSAIGLCMGVSLFMASCGSENEADSKGEAVPPSQNVSTPTPPSIPQVSAGNTDLTSECQEGPVASESEIGIVVNKDASGNYIVDLEGDSSTKLIGIFVTNPGAKLPKFPDLSLKGTAYWSVEAPNLIKPFSAPITYQQVPKNGKDTTVKHRGVDGGSPLAEIASGTCLQFAVISAYPQFKRGTYIVQH